MNPPRDVLRTIDASETPDRDHPIDDRPLLPTIDEERFAFGDERARGGIGKILEAHDSLLGRRIAVKQLLRGNAPGEAARFIREATLTARLQHPAIVPIYDAGVRGSGEPFYAMPLVPGRSLREAIDAARTLDERLALLPHVQAVADAIAYAHEQGIIHRDLKPSNVLVGAFGETVVIDWGLAKDTRSDDPEDDLAALPAAALDALVSVTRTGAVLGTPAYMAPEQARGEAASERTDVYAIGAMLYDVLTGAAPHGRSGPLAQVPPPVQAREPSVPRDLAAIVAKAMAPSASERYPSAQALAGDLRRFATGQLVGARRYSGWVLARRWLRRHRTTVTVALVLLTALAANAAVSARRVMHERDRAENENNRLHLLQAEAVVDRDPSAAAAWLASYRPEDAQLDRAAGVAARAADAGVARWVLRLPDEAALRVCVSPGATHAVVLGRSGAIWRFDLTRRTRKRLGSLTGLPSGCVFSSDGARFVAVAAGGVRVGGLAGDRLWTPALPASVADFKWSGTGAALVISDGHVLALDVRAESVRELAGMPAHVTHVVLAPDGVTGFASDAEGGLWQTGTPARQLEHFDEPMYQLSLSHDGKHLVAASSSLIYARDLDSGAGFRRSFEVSATDPIAARPAGADVVFISAIDQSVGVWQPASGAVRRLSDKAFWKTLVVSSDGARAAWANVDGSLMIADLAAGVTHTIIATDALVRSLDLSRDGRWLASTHGDLVRIYALPGAAGQAWSVSPMHGRGRLVDHSDGRVLFDEGTGRVMSLDPVTLERRLVIDLGEPVGMMTLMEKRQQLALCGERGVVVLLDLATGTRHELGRMAEACHMVDFLGDVLVASDQHQRQMSWDLPSLTRRPDLTVDAAFLARSRPLPPSTHPGSRIASILDDGLMVQDVATGELQRIVVPGKAFGGKLTHAENSGVFGMSDGRVVEWRLGEDRVRELARLPGFVTYLLYAPDEREIYVGSEGGVVAAIRLADGQVRRLGAHRSRVAALTQSRSGRRLASGDTSGEIRVFEPASGDVAVLHAPGSELRWLAFVSDDLLVSLDAAGGFRLWPLADVAFVPHDGRKLRAWSEALTTARTGSDDAHVETQVFEE